MTKVRQQIKFDSFESMVACKIMWEGKLLCGSPTLFQTVKELIVDAGIPEKLNEMEQHASIVREKAESILLSPPSTLTDKDVLTLFYTREESEEIY
jgi:hypothetical protein